MIDKKQNPIIEVKSRRKGSNPGGLCSYNHGRNRFEGYFKYCIGSKIPNKYSSLKPDHQPFYEAITFELARRMGLHNPGFFVLLNSEGNVEFKDSKKFSQNGHSGRHSYFVSKIIKEPKISNLDEIGAKIVEKERIYLESLMISDILGRRQNYLVLPEGYGNFKVSYVDLGCSFIHAVRGFIYFPTNLRKLDKKCKRIEKCKLKRKTIIAADDDSLINLEEFVDNFENLTLPILNPYSRRKLEDLISGEEMDEIRSFLIHGLCNSLGGFKARGLLI